MTKRIINPNPTDNHPKTIERKYRDLFKTLTDEELVDWHNQDCGIEKVGITLMIKMYCLYDEMEVRGFDLQCLNLYNISKTFTGFNRNQRMLNVIIPEHKALLSTNDPAPKVGLNSNVRSVDAAQLPWATKLMKLPWMQGRRLKVLDANYHGIELPDGWFDVVNMVEFCRDEPDRLPLLCANSWAHFIPNLINIPGFFNGNKPYILHKKFFLSGFIVGAGIYQMHEGDLTLVFEEGRKIANVTNDKEE